MTRRDPMADMTSSQALIRGICAELIAGGIDPLCVSAALNTVSGSILRLELPVETDRRKVVLHAAEMMITGKPTGML